MRWRQRDLRFSRNRLKAPRRQLQLREHLKALHPTNLNKQLAKQLAALRKRLTSIRNRSAPTMALGAHLLIAARPCRLTHL